jgi:hypothetical protein
MRPKHFKNDLQGQPKAVAPAPWAMALYVFI